METDAPSAFSYITGPLSPSARRAVARAKNAAQRALPGDAAASDSAQPKARENKTNITLVVDPTSHLVVARVIDGDTGDVIRQLPSAEAVRFVAASHEMLGQLAGAKYKETEDTVDVEPKHAVSTDMTA